MTSIPTLTRIVALGPSGPFEPDEHPLWVYPLPSHIRVLDPDGYRRAMVEAGYEATAATRIAGLMRRDGIEEILWATGQGGERGHLYRHWDVRVARSPGDARPTVEEVASEAGIEGPFVPGGFLESVTRDPTVVAATTAQMTEQSVPLDQDAKPRWAQLLRVPMCVVTHYTHGAYIAIALGSVGATISAAAPTASEADAAVGRAFNLLMKDVASLD